MCQKTKKTEKLKKVERKLKEIENVKTKLKILRTRTRARPRGLGGYVLLRASEARCLVAIIYPSRKRGALSCFEKH